MGISLVRKGVGGSKFSKFFFAVGKCQFLECCLLVHDFLASQILSDSLVSWWTKKFVFFVIKFFQSYSDLLLIFVWLSASYSHMHSRRIMCISEPFDRSSYSMFLYFNGVIKLNPWKAMDFYFLMQLESH